MKRLFLLILTFIFMRISNEGTYSRDENDTDNNIAMTNSKIKIKVNSQTVTATLLDNNSAKAFKEMRLWQLHD